MLSCENLPHKLGSTSPSDFTESQRYTLRHMDGSALSLVADIAMQQEEPQIIETIKFVRALAQERAEKLGTNSSGKPHPSIAYTVVLRADKYLEGVEQEDKIPQ